MTRLEAFNLLDEHKRDPIFTVKIGMCSPQVVNVDLETALREFDRCIKFRDPSLIEYVYIFCNHFIEAKLAEKLNRALYLVNLGDF